MKTGEDQICFSCEFKTMLFWKQDYICLLQPDALYLMRNPRNAIAQKKDGQGDSKLQSNTVENTSNSLKFSAENTTDYRFEITYDPQAPDWTPIDEIDQYCILSFRTSSGKKLFIRSDCKCDIKAIHEFADKIFSKGKRDLV